MASLLEGFMSQLLSKEVLYEPLQQICARVSAARRRARRCTQAQSRVCVRALVLHGAARRD
jgi:hypothetical protein